MRMATLQHHSALGGHLAFENLKSSIGHTKLLADTNMSGQEASSAIRELTQQVQITTNQNLGCYESISEQTADYRANQEISNRASENLRQDILAVTENVGTGNVEIQKN
ncbi:hypothetical protein MMC22_006960 [Lobaria immixta]|nr:hypothetical protein [Lobaria immixta]